MRGSQGMMICLLAAAMLLMAGSAEAQSKSRFGVGYSVTHYDPTFDITFHMPKFVFQSDVFTAGGGFQLHSGEDITNFILEFDFAAKAIKHRSGSINFGGQMHLMTDGVVSQNAQGKVEKDAIFGFGGFAEGMVEVAPNMSVSARIYPFQIASGGDATRFALLSAGATISYLF